MANTDEDDIKIILLGQSGVGKTNLINVFIGKQFDSSANTTSTSYCFEGEYNYNNKSYRYNLWDTAGQEKFRAINKMFIRGSKIILIVYSIDYKQSFDEIDFWINSVKENLGDDKYIMGLVANKSDLYLKQQVKDEEGKEVAKKYGIDFLTTSALTDAESFKEFLHKLLEDYIKMVNVDQSGKGKAKGKNNNIKINNDNKNDDLNKKKCC